MADDQSQYLETSRPDPEKQATGEEPQGYAKDAGKGHPLQSTCRQGWRKLAHLSMWSCCKTVLVSCVKCELCPDMPWQIIAHVFQNHLSSREIFTTGHLIMIFLIVLICWQHKALSLSSLACFPGFLFQPCRSPGHLNLSYRFTRSRHFSDHFCHLGPQSKAPNPLPKLTSFIQ